MVSVLEQGPAVSDSSYRTSWLAADAAATAALSEALDGDPAVLNEVVAARLVAGAPFSALVVSSSMPIRDLEWFAPQVVAPMVWSNRGANGIDGVVSTAIGTTFATDGPVAVVVGDLAFLHDLTALVDGLGAEGGSLTVVVVDNGGGGIFSFLPQASAVDPSTFSALFLTARPIDHRAVVTGLGHTAISVTSGNALADALEESAARPGITVIHVPVPAPDANVSLHDQLNAAVGAAVAAVL
jgi:2-succinyl-5-enolpyruvyl-6-hydroxy-3-cyclohexene-1-carboxylate synthase